MPLLTSEDSALNTIADLQLIANGTPDPNRLYRVRGYYAANDGGGHRDFYWNPTLTTTVDADDDGVAERSDDYGLTILAPTNLPTISSPGRFVAVINTPYLNVLWGGVRHTVSTDQAPRINLVLKQAVRANNVFFGATNTGENDALIQVLFPSGVYRIESTIQLTTQSPRGAKLLKIVGQGRTWLEWWGSNPEVEMFRLTKYYWSEISNFQVRIRKGIKTVFLLENDGSGNGPTSTRMKFREILIAPISVNGAEYIYNGRAIQYGFEVSTGGGGGDTNNDIGDFEDVQIDACNVGINIAGFNPHQFYFHRCSFLFCNWGLIGGSSFHWSDGISSTVTYAVFVINSNNKPIIIDSHNDEHSGRFIESNSLGSSVPVVLRGCRWSSERTIQDIAINLYGNTKCTISIENCYFGDSKNKVNRMVGLAEVVNENINAYYGLRVLNTMFERVTNNLSGTTSPLFDQFNIGLFEVSQSQFDFVNNEINLGYAHHMTYGQVLHCMNGGNSSFGFTQSMQAYFVIPHATDPNRFKLAADYSNTTPVTFTDNGGSKIMKLRLGGSRMTNIGASTGPDYAVWHSNSQPPHLPVLPKDSNLFVGIIGYKTGDTAYRILPTATAGNVYKLVNIYSSGNAGELRVTVQDFYSSTTYLIGGRPAEFTPGQWYKCTPISSNGTASNQANAPELVVQVGYSPIFQDFGSGYPNFISCFTFGILTKRNSDTGYGGISLSVVATGGNSVSKFFAEETSQTIAANTLTFQELPNHQTAPWFKGAPSANSNDSNRLDIPIVINGVQYYIPASTTPNQAYVKAVTPNAKLWLGTQAQYDALGTYDANTSYQVVP